MAQDFTQDPRVYLAAERTFLAWIRTGLALMGFGFVVARFGLFLRELSSTRPDLHVRSSGFSIGTGTALILIGVVMNIASAVRHVQLIGELKRGADTIARPSYAAIAVAVVLALIGAAMVIYMGVMW
jgi:putative membrane protein